MAKKKKDASVELSQDLRQLPAAWKDDSMGEIVIYNPVDTIKIEVRLGRESVWLTQSQLSVLFDVDRTVIVRHVGNIYRSGELEEDSTCAKIAQVQSEGGRMVERVQKYYNLDMILSVGYRVNSRNATTFRRWANFVLKEYLLRGYAINPRLEQLEQRVAKTEEKIDFFVRTALPPVEGIFYDGQIFDAYEFASKLIKSAKKEIILIDNYVDETVLTMLDKRGPAVKATIYTKQLSAQFQLDLNKHNAQYPLIEVHAFNKAHDRFLIVDEAVYHIGASLKDLGKKWFAFSLMQDLTPNDLISRI
jgi:hypothetical protein